MEESKNTTLSQSIKKLLQLRGHTTEAAMKNFFSWNLNELPDLAVIPDIDLAAKIIVESVEAKEKIGIFGDYDADGTTSCALLSYFFKMLFTEVTLFQPNRFSEGYGLHRSSIDNAINAKISLLITVDCGITDVESAAYAKELGLKLVITDHHMDTKDELPEALAIVNPNRRDSTCNTELKNLAGVGVAFALALRMRQLLLDKGLPCPSIYPLLQFVAIGTISDLAPLSPANLKLCRHGLKQMVNTSYPGIAVFISPEERAFETIPSEKVSFTIGPMINSKGRIDHPGDSLGLLVASDDKSAFQYYSQLEISNKERRFVQGEIFSEAKKIVISEIGSDQPVISVVYKPDWHEGVIGIVASKLVDNFEIPAICFTNSSEQGVIKGSARSAGPLDLFKILTELKDYFIKFGGHRAAAGMSMKRENFEPFKKAITDKLKLIPAIERTEEDRFDLFIKFSEITPKLIKDLSLLEPFGMGNEKPIFRMNDFKIDSYTILKDSHVKWFFSSKKPPTMKLQGISFNYMGKWNQRDPSELFKIQDERELTAQFVLGLNRFNGNEYIQLMVQKFYS